MSLGTNSIDLQAQAVALDSAARERREIDPPQQACTLAQAYQIQRASIAQRHQRGEQPIGIKLGFTSRAKMVQMGVDSLIWGWLTDAMLHADGGTLDFSDFIHPRVEPEVCFLTRRVIDRPLTMLEAVAYLEAVAPAMEIIDSRYRNFKFALEDVVADNCSSAALVTGAFSDDFRNLVNRGVAMRFNGHAVQLGSTGAILGNPLRSIVQASQLLSQAEMSLPAGSLIMAGAATAAEALTPGLHVATEIGALGRVEFFVGQLP
ncbi:2-keto-4-pentenoate hydratase [Verminephrobacter eiseniae]|uniref:2-keto-4-pentenoate hydratase n=1 Tax=Verminephrobacter eiseniae TaxID=364317 RepID=UPI0022377179|nr:fumarylacetoacetate hydrolase family protein [Verminephrobacter eiseniae]MCW5233239.1 4-oxalocrotonate decarboxylase [Verminephrobacter eiseniae]MCW5295207.1 4-oxalocrotonate decarboxylase [Verminephrobacter eiseniae]MCW8184141.1 4-oxalocrotonate decarboxylase [Verminephrobacter eiseniae]MCW8222686.1 4-oxalocrotonate decarboxylase [Verminephrobacter eiseniae]MCW8234156.1 4-oxalocrotonate decarboxylase [Verminephrobacter eiseniae]